ncbi:MAG: hypothetical protein IKQ33_02290 [Clostridia bacterium]|nr:hypothetical protein [Clostridia bacterium]
MKISRRYYGLKGNPRLKPVPSAKVVHSEPKETEKINRNLQKSFETQTRNNM